MISKKLYCLCFSMNRCYFNLLVDIILNFTVMWCCTRFKTRVVFCIRSGYKFNKFAKFYFQVYVYNKVEGEACALPAQYYKHSNIILFPGTSIDFNCTVGNYCWPWRVALHRLQCIWV